MESLSTKETTSKDCNGDSVFENVVRAPDVPVYAVIFSSILTWFLLSSSFLSVVFIVTVFVSCFTLISFFQPLVYSMIA